jgi:TP901 family phage tail tape measure protein
MSINSEESTINIRLSGDQARAEIKKLQEATAQFNRELKKLNDPAQIKVKREQIDQAKADIAKLRASIKENLTVIINGQVAGKSINDLRSALSLAKKEFKTMVDPAEMKAQAASINQIQRQIDHLESPLKKSQGAFGGLINEMKRMAALAASAFGFQFLINKFEDLLISNAKLSDSFANIRRVTGLTDEEVRKLNSTLQQIDTRTSTQGLRELSVVAGKLGVNGVKDIAAFTESLDMLVVSLGDELGSADEIATQLGKILNVFEGKITADDLTHLGNAMVSLANNGVATGGFIADFSQRVSGIAKASNLSLGATVGLAAGFEELGLRSESSATALQKLLSTIAGDIPKAAKIAGIDVKKFNDLFSNKPQEALILYAQGLVKNKQSFAEITSAFKDAGEEGARVVQTLQAIGQRGEFLKEKIDLGNKSMQESSQIFSAFALKNDNLAASLEKTGKLIGKYFTNNTLTDFFNTAVKGINFQLSSTTEKKSALQISIDTIKTNREEVKTIRELLAEYEKLTSNGLAPTNAQKGRLHAISIQLNELTGKSVGTLNKETGAYQVNTELVKKYANEKQQANLSEAASILNIIHVQEQNLAVVIANKKANEDLHASLRAFVKEKAVNGVYNSPGDAAFKESKRLIEESEKLNHRIVAYSKSIEKRKADLAALGYNPDAIAEALKQIRDTRAIVDAEKTKPGGSIEGDGSESKTMRERNKELVEYYKTRLTTITTFAYQEESIEKLKLKEISNINNAAKAEQLQSQLTAIKIRLDLSEEASREELQAKKDYLEKEYQLYAEKLGAESSLAIAAKRKLHKDLAELDSQFTQNQIADIRQGLELATQLYAEYNNYLTLRENNQTTIARNEAAKRKKDLDEKLKHDLISQQEYTIELEKINSKADQIDIANRKKQFERNKKLQEAQIAVNAASAIIKLYSDYNYIVATALGLILTGVAAAQISEVEKQQFPEYEDGGILHGPRHKDGGIPIVSKRSGKPFASAEGGELLGSRAFVNDYPNLAQSIANYTKNGQRINLSDISVSSSATPSINTDSITRTISKALPFSGISSSTITPSNGGSSENMDKLIKEIVLMKEELTKIKDKKVIFVHREYEKSKEQLAFAQRQTQV